MGVKIIAEGGINHNGDITMAEKLIDIADLVTEMSQIKHPFRGGVKAQKGIEF